MRKVKILINLVAVLSLNLSGSIVFSQRTVLKAGIAKMDITPIENLYMGGYDENCRSDPSNGSFGNIFIRALVFDDNITRMAFVEVDIVSFPPDNYIPIRQLIATQTGISFENILLGCTHNHAAPYPDEKNKNSDWSKQLNNKLVSTIKKAVDDLEPVKIGGGTGRSYIAMNRRRRMQDTVSYLTFDENYSSQSHGKYKTEHPVEIREMEGVYRLGSNPGGPIDNEVGVLRIDKLNGEPKAVFVNYACHGTSLGGRNNTISPEWNGHMLEYIEETLPGVTGIFMQGAAGDINPRYVGGLDGHTDDLKKTAELGYEIGKEVVRVFAGITTAKPINSEIKCIRKDIICPKRYREILKDIKVTTLPVPTTAMKIDDFTWVTFPGELFHEIGKQIKASTHSQYQFIVGYCNGSVGYLPTQQSHSEGGYEPWTTPFAPVTEKIYVKGVEKMLNSLY